MNKLQNLATQACYEGIEKLVYRNNKCLDLMRDYIEKEKISSRIL